MSESYAIIAVVFLYVVVVLYAVVTDDFDE